MTDSSSVEFRTDDNRNLVMRLAATPADADGFGGFDVVVEAEGVRAERAVLTYGGDGLDAFFQSLAADWRGWEGTRTWDAVERGLTIEATIAGAAPSCSSFFGATTTRTPGSFGYRFVSPRERHCAVSPRRPLGRLQSWRIADPVRSHFDLGRHSRTLAHSRRSSRQER
jgi:hypothetical protein